MKEHIESVTFEFSKDEAYIEPSVLFELLKELRRKYSGWIVGILDIKIWTEVE